MDFYVSVKPILGLSLLIGTDSGGSRPDVLGGQSNWGAPKMSSHA